MFAKIRETIRENFQDILSALIHLDKDYDYRKTLSRLDVKIHPNFKVIQSNFLNQTPLVWIQIETV